MELGGIFSESMIDRSRKKDHYFDTDYSPFLIEDPQYGILRIPDSRPIHVAVLSKDLMFLDFISKCLELDPEIRFGAKQALMHPWMRDYDEKNVRNFKENKNDAIDVKVSGDCQHEPFSRSRE